MQRFLRVLILPAIMFLPACGKKNVDPGIFPAQVKSLHDMGVFLSLAVTTGDTDHRNQLHPKTSLIIRLLSHIGSNGNKPLEKQDVSLALNAVRNWRDIVAETPVVETVEHPRNPVDYWTDARSQLDLAPIGISRLPDGKYSAMLNGFRKIEEGDNLSAIYMDRTYRWTVNSISKEGFISLRELDVE